MLAQCPALAHLDLRGNSDFGAAGAGRLARVLGQCRELVHLPWRTYHGSPQSLEQSDRRCWGKEACRSACAVPSPDSPQYRRQCHRHCRAREVSSFVVRSSLWPCFVSTLHFLLFAICLADRNQERATYCTHTAWQPSGLHFGFEL